MLTIAGGPSVNDYPREELISLAKDTYTIAVNEACFDFPCDVVVVLDPLVRIPKLVKELQKIGKPVICRKWVGQDKLGLDLIEIANESVSKYQFSGMAGIKLADEVAGKFGLTSYILGIDASWGNYKGYQSTITDFDYSNLGLKPYEQLNLTNTINLSMNSNVPYWTKQSKLPNTKFMGITSGIRVAITNWIRLNAGTIL